MKMQPNFPIVRRVEDPPWLPVFRLKGALPEKVETHRCGVLFILFMPPQGEFDYRITVASQTRYPTLDELMHIFNSLVPDAISKPAVIMLPTQVAYDDPKNFALTIQVVAQEQVVENAV